MTTSTSRPLGILGDAERRACCPALCDYRVEAVQVYLDIVLWHERRGTDPVEPLRRRSRDQTGSTVTGDGDERIWDVQMAVERVRAAGQLVCAETVARALCPWSLEG